MGVAALSASNLTCNRTLECCMLLGATWGKFVEPDRSSSRPDVCVCLSSFAHPWAWSWVKQLPLPWIIQHRDFSHVSYRPLSSLSSFPLLLAILVFFFFCRSSIFGRGTVAKLITFVATCCWRWLHLRASVAAACILAYKHPCILASILASMNSCVVTALRPGIRFVASIGMRWQCKWKDRANISCIFILIAMFTMHVARLRGRWGACIRLLRLLQIHPLALCSEPSNPRLSNPIHLNRSQSQYLLD